MIEAKETSDKGGVIRMEHVCVLDTRQPVRRIHVAPGDTILAMQILAESRGRSRYDGSTE